jgi:hypothetical protein
MINESMSIIRDSEQDYLPIPLPGAEGVYANLAEAAQVDAQSLVEIIVPAA